jgi:hypothetical protein
LLREIRGIRIIPGQSPQEAEDSPIKKLDQLGRGRVVAPAKPLDHRIRFGFHSLTGLLVE